MISVWLCDQYVSFHLSQVFRFILIISRQHQINKTFIVLIGVPQSIGVFFPYYPPKVY